MLESEIKRNTEVLKDLTEVMARTDWDGLRDAITALAVKLNDTLSPPQAAPQIDRSSVVAKEKSDPIPDAPKPQDRSDRPKTPEELNTWLVNWAKMVPDGGRIVSGIMNDVFKITSIKQLDTAQYGAFITHVKGAVNG